jgi:hypothetical protein
MIRNICTRKYTCKKSGLEKILRDVFGQSILSPIVSPLVLLKCTVTLWTIQPIRIVRTDDAACPDCPGGADANREIFFCIGRPLS